jgi:PKD repeat protein
MNKTYFSPSSKVFYALFCFFTTLTITLSAQLPTGFVDIKLQGGYTSPMGVVFSKNGQKMFVWEKKGKLWCSAWNGTAYVKQSTAVLDISPEVGDWRDFGLHSVALDPNFDANGLIYLYYQVDRHHLMKFGTPQYSATTDEYYKASISRLTRYKVNVTNGVAAADNASRKILLGETKSTGVPLLYESHAGGQILFGTDGSLLVSTGDNASFITDDMGSANETYWQQAIADGIMRSTENVGAFRSQQINSFCGKVLRLDPNTGDGISSNPYFSGTSPRSAKSRVWALGFRNPYRMCFKSGTGSTSLSAGNPGTIIVGDVQNGTWEEVDVIEKGGVNCGWPLYEGITPQYQYYDSGKKDPEEVGNPTFLSQCVRGGSTTINNPTAAKRRFVHFAPAIDWKHGENTARYVDYTKGVTEEATNITASSAVTGAGFGGNCVTMGTYYPGTTFPLKYRNAVFFGDYQANWIRALCLNDNNKQQAKTVLEFAPATYAKGIVDIEYCPRDESIVYVNINTGDIKKISYGATNRPPVAAMNANKTSGTSPLVVNFNSTGSSDPDGDAISYKWDFGDGSATSTLANPAHTFTSTIPKGFTVTLRVMDSKGLTDTKTMVISLNNTPPSVKITSPISTFKYNLLSATQLNLKANVTDNDPTGMQYAWQVTLRHNIHEHRDPVINQASPTVSISPVGCDADTYYYLIELQVKDNGGLTANDSVKIYPDCGSGNIAISNLKATAQTQAVAVTWTNPAIAFDEVMVVAKPTSGFNARPTGTTYTANSNFTGTGTAYDGGKVVYRGTGTNVTVTNLTAGTPYYFRVYTRKGTVWSGGVEISATPTTAQSLAVTNLKALPQTNILAISWTNPIPVFDEVMVAVKANTPFSVTPGKTDYLTDLNFTGVGSSFDGGKIVYRGLGTNCSVFNLTGGTRYYVRVFTRKGTTWTSGVETSAVPNSATANLPPIVAFSADRTTGLSPLPVVFNSIGTSDPEGGTLTYSWNFGDGTPLSAAANPTHLFNSAVAANFTVTLTVTDNQGLKTSKTLVIAVTNQSTQNLQITNLVATPAVRLINLNWVNPTVPFDEVMVVINANAPFTLTPVGINYVPDASFTGQVVYNGKTSYLGFVPPIIGARYYIQIFIRSGTVWSAGVGTSAIELVSPPPPASGPPVAIISANQTSGAAPLAVLFNASSSYDPDGGPLSYTWYLDWGGLVGFMPAGSGSTFAQAFGAAGGLPGTFNYSVKLTVTDNQGLSSSAYSVITTITASVAQNANLLSVNGHRQGKKGIITWVSSVDDKTDYFMVQKLNAQGSGFEILETVDAQTGTVDDKKFYTIEDNTPFDSVNIYRVALYRKGEQTPQYSDLISLDFSFLNDFIVFPNPSNDYVDIDLEAVRDKPVNITILDIEGKIVKQKKIESAPVEPLRINIEDIKVGAYFIQIKTEGKREVVKKLMIAR